MDIYDENLSDSKVVRRPPRNSLWAQTGDDDMAYIEDSTKEFNAKKIEAEIQRYNSYMKLREEYVVIPPRLGTNCNAEIVSHPTSAARKPSPEPEKFEPVEAIESVVVTEQMIFEENVEKIGKTKKKLNLLVEYARGHANRKIIGAWDIVLEEFKQSSDYDIVLVPGSQKPVKIKTLALVKLVTLLAGPEIQFKKQEIESLCDKFDIPVDVQHRVRRLSAMHITKEATTNLPLKMRCDDEINTLMKDFKDHMISKTALEKAVFPDDPERLKFELEMIEREKIAKRMIEDEENKKKIAYAEIIEQRRLRSIDDWQRALSTLQYPRGPLTPQREYVFREVIEYSRYVLSVQEEASMTIIDPAIISNLGNDVFGFDDDKREIVPSLETISLSFDENEVGMPSPQTPSQKNPVDASRFRTNLRGLSPEQLTEMKGKPRLKLMSDVSIIQLLTDAVALGKGLNGVSFKDVIELVQAFAATRIQTYFRCHTKRWRFEKARKCWKKAFCATKGRVFGAWATEARKIGTLKRYCMRKIVVWKFYVKRLKERQYYFKQCFWPFFVWRRTVLASTTTKQKTKFLCGRLVPTLITMRIFRAWSKYAVEESYYTKKAQGFINKKQAGNFRDSFHWLKYWAARRKNLRRQWLKEGLTMKRRFDDQCVKRPFQVWYSWVQLKRRLNSSIKANCSLFRTFVLPNKEFVSDREITWVTPEPSLMESNTGSKQSMKSRRSTIKPGSKGSQRKKSRLTQRSLSAVAVKVIGKRKALKIDPFKEFSWSEKQIAYDIDNSEDDEPPENFFPRDSQLCEMFSRPNSMQTSRPGTNAGTRPPTSSSHLPTSDGAKGVDNTKRPSVGNILDLFAKPLTPAAEERISGRRATRTGKIVLGDIAAFAQDEVVEDEEISRASSAVPMVVVEEPSRTVSEMIQIAFEEIKIPIPEYDPVALFYRIRPVTVDNIGKVQELMNEVEVGALMETAFRYHRWGIRAFKNLQKFALIRRNARKGLKKKRIERLRFIFKVLCDNLNRSLSADITTSVAEQLINEARLAKVDKFTRRRELTDAIKHYQEHQLQLERARIQALKASLKQNSSMEATAGTEKSSANDSRANTPGVGLRNTGLAALGEFTQSIDDKGSLFPLMPEASIGSIDSILGSQCELRPTASQENLNEGSTTSLISLGSCSQMPSFRGGSRSKRNRQPLLKAGDDSSVVSKANSAFGSTRVNPASSVMTDMTEPPKVDYLFWDREDRELQFNNVQRLVAHGKRMAAMTEYCANILALGEDHVLKLQAKKFMALSDLEGIQDRQTKESISKEQAFVAGFRQYAAQNLLNAVYKVQTEFKHMMVRSCMRQYFKALRLSMLLKRSKHMCARKKMVNWIRICRRLNNIDRLTPKYFRARKLWGIWNRWLKYFERSHMDATPSVIGRARRGWELRKGFADYLRKKRVVLTYYHPTAKKIKSPCTDAHGLFQRWKQYVQDEVIYRMLEDFTHHKYELTLMRKVIYGWRYGTLTHAEQKAKIDCNPDCYAIAHVTEDIAQIIKRFISRVRLSLPRKLKRLNTRYLYCVRRDARKTLSFKKFIQNFHTQAEERIEQENSLLLTAFEARGSLMYRQTRILPEMALLNDGEKFSDPVFQKYEKPFSGLQIPGGYTISKIRVALKGSSGLVGWQLYWDADKCAPIVGPERGCMAGIGVITHDVVLKPFDFLLSVEYIYEGNEMAAIRFKTFKAGWSKWIGTKPSLTAVTQNFSVDAYVETEDIPQELQYNSTGPDEEEDTALPSMYIIGFLGEECSERASCLGVIFRHVITQNVFTYYWVNEGKDNQIFLERPPLHILAEQEQQVWDEDIVYEDDEGSADTKKSAIEIAPRPGSGITSKDPGSRPNTGGGANTLPPMSAGSKQPTQKQGTAFGAMGGPAVDIPAPASNPTKKPDQFDDEKETTESEDTFFDICRMRSVELKHLEERTDIFIRKVWKNVKLRNSSRQESKLVGLTCLKGIATWFFEGLCKKLVPLAKHAEECRSLLKSIRSTNLKKCQCDARLGSLRSGLAHMKSVEHEQPWYGKSFLGPMDRIQRKTYFENILDYEQSIEKMEIEIRDSAVHVLTATRRIRMLTPQLQLSKRIFNNFSLKLMAGRQKYTLLERMSLEQMRQQLMGNEAKMAATANTTDSNSLTGAPSDPNLASLSLEQVCAALESQRLEEENKQEYSVTSSTTVSKHFRKTLADEANSIMGHSLDAERDRLQKSYPEGTFGNKLAEGRAVWESKKHALKVMNATHTISQLASPKNVHIPVRDRKEMTTDVSPSLRHSASFTRLDPMKKSSADISLGVACDTNYDAMLAAESNARNAIRRIPTIDTPIIVPGRKNSVGSVKLSRSAADILTRRGLALMNDRSRTPKPAVPMVPERHQYVSDLTEEEIQNHKDFEANFHTFLAEQTILAKLRRDEAARKEEFLKRKLNLKKLKECSDFASK